MNSSSTSTNAARNRRRRLRKRQIKKVKNVTTTVVTPVPSKRQQKLNMQSWEPTVPKFRFSECTKAYGQALINPFRVFEHLPCIPDTIVLPSNKFLARCRGVMYTASSAGNGYVLFNPFQMAYNDAVDGGTFRGAPIHYTGPTGTYGHTGFSCVITGGAAEAGVIPAGSNSPYDGNFLNDPSRSFRLVAAGLAVRFIGSSFYNGGRVILYRNQSNAAIPNGTSASTLLNDNYAVSVPLSRKMEYITYTPDDPLLLGYQKLAFYDPLSGGADRSSILIYVDGASSSNPAVLEFEAISYFELLGSNIPLTRSEADPVGMASIITGLPTSAPTTSPEVAEQSMWDRAYNALQHMSGPAMATASAAVQLGGMYMKARYGTSRDQFASINYPTQGVTIEDV